MKLWFKDITPVSSMKQTFSLHVDHMDLGIIYPTPQIEQHEKNEALKDFPTPYARHGLNLEAVAVLAIYYQLVDQLPFYSNDAHRTSFEIALAIDAAKTGKKP